MNRLKFIKTISISAFAIPVIISSLGKKEEIKEILNNEPNIVKVSPKGIPLKNHSGLKSQIESCNCEYYNIITKKELENFIEQFI